MVPTVVYNSALGGETIQWLSGGVVTGPVSNSTALQNPTVYFIFQGTSWNSTNAGGLAADAQTIIQSKYLSKLTDYGSTGTAVYGGYTIDNTAAPVPPAGSSNAAQQSFFINAAQTEINAIVPNMISWAKPQNQNAVNSPVYIVVYDTGFTNSNGSHEGGEGWNGSMEYNSNSNLTMNEIFIADWAGDQDGFTDTFSHEIVERIFTGSGNGLTMNASADASTDGEFQDAQIGDNEPDQANYTYRLDGSLQVQAYWSLSVPNTNGVDNGFGAFVVPDSNPQNFYLDPQWNFVKDETINGKTYPVYSYTKNNQLLIVGDQFGAQGNTIALSTTGNGGVQATLNGDTESFDSFFEQSLNVTEVIVQPGAGSSAINVLATPYNISTYIEDQGNDKVVVGNTFGSVNDGAGNLSSIHGLVAVAANGDIGEPGATYLYLDDSGDSVGQTVAMYDGQIDYGGAAPIYYNPSSFSTGDVTYIAVYGGSGGNTFNIENTSKLYNGIYLSTGTGNDTANVYATQGTLYDDNPGGSDTTNLGLGNTGNLNGFVWVTGEGATSLYISDSSDQIGRTVTMGDGSITGLGSGGISWTPTSSLTGGVISVVVDGGSGGNTFNVNNTSNLFLDTLLNTGTGNDTVNVYATQGGFYDFNPGGSDGVDVGKGNMGSISGFVDVYGPGSTEMTLDDSSDTIARTVTMNDGSVTGLGGGTGSILWTPTSSSAGGVTYVQVDGGSGNNTFNVNTTSNLFSGTFLLTGGGTDSISVQATKGSATTGGLEIFNQGSDATNNIDVGLGSVANINGTVSVQGYGAPAILVDDHLDTTARTVTLGDGSLTGLGNAGAVDYGVEYLFAKTSLTIDGPGKASIYNIQSTSFFSTATVNGGVGSDTFTLGSGNSLSGIQGAVTINGGGGTNTLNANDSSSGTGLSYSLSFTQLAGSDFAPITYAYASLHALNVTGGGNDTLTLLTPVPVVATTFNGGSGANTLVGPNATTTWTISGANSGKVDSVTFKNFQNLAGGTGSDLFNFTTITASLSGTLNGGTGTNNSNTISYSTLGSSYLVNVALSSNAAGKATAIAGGFSNINSLTGSADPANTLTGPNSTNEWIITGDNAGDVNTGPIRPFGFTSMAHLVGGTGVDTFRFHSSSSLVVGINGGGAPSGQGDWLKYSEFPSSSTVTVNLATGSATNINGGAAGAVTNIQNVLGSASGTNDLTGDSQGNILIGGSGLNTLVGGSGNSLLIGGSGHGSITGGSGQDILIAGVTTNNPLSAAGVDSLMAILAELRSTDTFAQKVYDLIHGTDSGDPNGHGSDLNGSNKLTWGGTVRASTGAFTLAGDTSVAATADWFFSSSSSTVNDFNDDGVKDEHNNNAIGVF
jgi:hypothetical protein